MEIHHQGASNSSRPFVILFAFICLCQISYAQVPAISGFSPSNGPAGTSVILNGSNFSATPDDNIVYFGATRAVVTDASPTELTVTVPTGTTYQPISVTLNGSTGYSLSPFVVTFQKNIALDPFSFSQAKSLTTGTGSHILAIADFDVDGKPDVVFGYVDYNAISLLRNTSVPGGLGSFEQEIVNVGIAGPTRVSAGDLDGDGMPDLVIGATNDDKIYILRNISTPGSLSSSSFEAPFSISTPSPATVAIADLDLDGRPELIVPTISTNTVSVFQNISTPGSLTAASFASNVGFTADTDVNFVATGDLDRDGKPELVVSHSGATAISILRNTSITGMINSGSFAAKQSFATDNGTNYVAIGDLDEDNLPDLVVANYSISNVISVFKNTSTVGSVNMDPRVDLTTDNLFAHMVAISDVNGDAKPDVTALNNGKLLVYPNISIPGTISAGSFGPRVDVGLSEVPIGMAFGDLNGDGKPDLINTDRNDNRVFFRVNLLTIPPTITSFNPNSGPVGTTVTISGSNYDVFPEYVEVQFNSVPATVISHTATSITARVPGGASFGRITVLVNSRQVISATDFSVQNPPRIDSFTPTSGVVGSSVVISGNFFSATAANNIVYFGATRATVTASSPGSLTVTVPAGATLKPISVTVNGMTGVSSRQFNVTFPSNLILNVSAFAPAVELPVNSLARAIHIQDMDGDGKSDIATVSSVFSDFSIFRNNSTGATISFDPRSSFGAGPQAFELFIGDVDGDTKPDVATPSATGNAFTVTRNISTPGSFTSGSMETGVTYSTGVGPGGISIADLNRDGKLDLVTSNFNSTISLTMNESPPGSIESSSIKHAVDIATSFDGGKLIVGDLDGDRKPDLIVTRYTSGNQISFYKNNNSGGPIYEGTFQTPVDLVSGQGATAPVIGDIDGDLKPEIVVANRDDGTISIFRNTGTTGFISFAVKFDLVTGPGCSGVAIGDLDGDGKPDLVATNNANNSISIFRNISVPGAIGAASFEPKVTLTSPGLNVPNCIAVGDLNNDGRPEIAVTNLGGSVVSVFRNQIPLPPPAITSFSPASGIVGTAVTITGNNFDTTPAGNVVQFNGTAAVVTSATATSMSTIAPAGATSGKISVTANGTTVTSALDFVVTVNVTVGLEDFLRKEGSLLYPNPAKDDMIIQLSRLPRGEEAVAVIYDLSGRQIDQKSGRGGEDLVLNVSAYTPSLYLIRLTAGNKTITMPFIKE